MSSLARTDPSLAPGAAIGGYRVERLVGEGAMGSVWAARDPRGGPMVAIKVMRRALLDDPKAMARFEREARVSQEARHPGIVEVREIGRLGDGRPYLVMPLLSGRSLAAELRERGRLPAREAWALARQLASALAAAHRANVVHRDLKPDNVFVEDPGGQARAVILDFGLAKDEAPGATKLTRTGAMLGTPAYMAPEQWWGHEVGPKADQYALGVLLFELLTGRAPFIGQALPELMEQHLHAAPPTLAGSGVAAGAEAEGLLAKAMAKDPAARFSSLDELVAAGDAAFGAPVAARVKARRSPGLLAAHAGMGAVGLAGLVAAGYAGPSRWSPGEWLRMAGPGVFVVVAAAAIGWLALAWAAFIRPSRSADPAPLGWFAAAAALLGSAATWTGWQAVLAALERVEPGERFFVFNEGLYEAGTSRFLGCALGALLCASLALLTGPSGRPAVPRRVLAAASAGLGALGILAAAAGAPSAAMVALSGGAFAAMGAVTAGGLTSASWALAGTGLAAIAAWGRLEARGAALWSFSATRAERAQEVIEAAGERTTSGVLVALCLGAAGAWLAAEAWQLRKRGGTLRLRRGVLVLAIVGLLAAVADQVLHAPVARQDRAFRAEIAGQFSLFGRLDPPGAPGLDAQRFKPDPGPALQLTRDVAAVNAVKVATLEALESERGRASLFDALRLALAESAEHGERSLSLLVDREVRWGTLQAALRLAREAGASRAQVLLTRGAPPALPPSAPGDAAFPLPTDFVAIPATLAAGGPAWPAERRFSELAPELAGIAAEGRPLVLPVGP